jgi:NADH:ubiquinone oxidoreductase subunit F (NADH-binding)
VAIRVEAPPDPYVAGEESALVHWLNGGESKPVFVPPRPFEKGVNGRPTLVNNVETLAHLALIARFGADWFRVLGTESDPGSALITMVGDVERAGVYEVSLGSSLETTMRASRPAGPAQAVLIGGYSGVWLAGSELAGLTLDSRSLRAAGATLGCGSLAALGEHACGLQETARIARWMSFESAGQCGPCHLGLPAMADALDALVAGERSGRALRRVRELCAIVAGRGACGHPDGVARMVGSALRVFAPDIERHRRHGPCIHCRSVLPLPSHPGVWI